MCLSRTGSTADVDFSTGKDTFLTDPGRCPVTHLVLDSGWEQKVAQVLEVKDPYDCRQDLLVALTFEPLVPV